MDRYFFSGLERGAVCQDQAIRRVVCGIRRVGCPAHAFVSDHSLRAPTGPVSLVLSKDTDADEEEDPADEEKHDGKQEQRRPVGSGHGDSVAAHDPS